MARNARHKTPFRSKRILGAGLGLVLGASASHAQFRPDFWEQAAAREAQRARDAQRAEFIRAQYERRRSVAHARLRSDEASTLYASTLSTADVQLSCPVQPAPGMRNVIELVIDGRHDPVSSAGGVPGQPGPVGPLDWPGIFSPVVPQASPAWDFDAVHAGYTVSDDRGARAPAGTAAAHGLPFLPSASDARARQGIAHVLNRSAKAGEVRIVAVDDSGRRYGPLRLSIGANGTAHVTSADIENGNPDKGLFGATGPGVGDWRLELSSDLDIEALSYVRASDGLVTAMHDVAPSEGTRHRVPFFNAASNFDQESRLRLINPGRGPTEVAITGIDSQGEAPGHGVAVTLPAGASLTYTAAELESGTGAGLRGSLGDGAGEWRLIVESEQPLRVMSLISSSTGHLTNLSTVPSNEARDVHSVPLFPATSDPLGRQGLVRVVNRTNTAGEVRVKAHDDTQWDYAPLVLPVGAGETVHFDSNDLEQGNPGKGLDGGTGAGQGDWRLELSGDVDIEALSYVRAWDGLLTPMHDVVPSEAEGTRHRVAMFDPESSPEQERVLRLINPGSEPAEVAITGVDARGRSLGDGVAVRLLAGASRTYTAEELQTGAGAGLRGSLGDGTGEWRLTVESQEPLQVMSLLSATTGHLSNLSTAPVLVPKTPPLVFPTDSDTTGAETVEDVFRTEVSPIVQAQCIVCHRTGGFPADVPNSRLQLNPATEEDHVALNLAVFEAFIEALGEDEQVEDPATYILNKVQGVDHGGGLQLTAGTDNYLSLQRFLGLLGEAVAPVGITPETLFEGLTMESARSTLRRAALVFAGRVPTQAEYATVQGGSEDALRTTIRGLMSGPEFHEFLIRTSNDRLLTDRHLRDHTIENSGYFVDYDNEYYRLEAMDPHTRWLWDQLVQYGAGRAPLELIAHVVENDLPYTEILTADYIMANPSAATAYGADTDFEDPTNAHEFKPSEIVSYFRDCDGKVNEYTPEIGLRVLDPGPCATEFPHAGILSTKVFLKRYPSTATNRNRARSRWTYYHFLGVDIEKSAPRTTDPTALADTSNPTMNNPACTVCHSVLDPVAGAFQNYGDIGLYRDQHGGMDSLDGFYKDPPVEQLAINATSQEESETISSQLFLTRTARILVSTNYGRDWREGADRPVALDNLVVEDPNGNEVYQVEFEDLQNHECGWAGYNEATGEHDHWIVGASWTQCRLRIPIEIPADGMYNVSVITWSEENENDERLAELQLAATPFRDGDTWYRDMVVPGFGDQLAPNPESSLQWLAQQIIRDERLAEAAVKFWWPAIMGAEVAEPPEDETDADFEGLLLASNAQAAEVTRLANGFRSGFHDGSPYNLKDLLVETILSKWFRAESLSGDDPVRAIGLGNVGARRLLTPEELARKTLALTGFQWGRDRGPNPRPQVDGQSHLTDAEYGYALLYGGIDSDGITERARNMTSVMAGVAQSHALQTSCPVMMREFYLLPDDDRLLFEGIDKSMSPISEFGESFDIEADSWSARETLTQSGHLSAGTKTLALTFTNNHSDDDGDRNVRLYELNVKDQLGQTVHNRNLKDLAPPVTSWGECGHANAWNPETGESDHFNLHSTCAPAVTEFSIPSDGLYTVEVVAWADQYGEDSAELEIVVQSDTVTSAGAASIRGKLVELYDRLHGIGVGTDSPDVSNAYDLFVDVWNRRRESDDTRFYGSGDNIACVWGSDSYYLDGIVDDYFVYRDDWEWGEGWGLDRDLINSHFEKVDWSDPHSVAETWTVILAYLMMDYRYLYL